MAGTRLGLIVIVLGCFLLLGGCKPFDIGFNIYGQRLGHDSTPLLALLIAGLMFSVAFVVYRTRR